VTLQGDLPFVLFDITFAPEQEEIAYLLQVGINAHFLREALEELQAFH